MSDIMILITGNTYPVKEQIKAMGGRWDAAASGWRVPAERADEALALVQSANATSPSGRLTCRDCGQTGKRGDYPFSTLPGSGLCDDCC